MNEVKVKTKTLIQTLVDNRDKHIKEFEIAYDGFRNQVISLLEINLEEAKTGGKVVTRIDLIPPASHEEDYDVAIGMLEMHTEDTVNINDEEYRNFILDEWFWSGTFSSSSASYSSSSSLSR